MLLEEKAQVKKKWILLFKKKYLIQSLREENNLLAEDDTGKEAFLKFTQLAASKCGTFNSI